MRRRGTPDEPRKIYIDQSLDFFDAETQAILEAAYREGLADIGAADKPEIPDEEERLTGAEIRRLINQSIEYARRRQELRAAYLQKQPPESLD